MGDSVAALWDSELLRARQWLAATRRAKHRGNDRLFQRVKAHIGYKDHQLSLQTETTASEDEDDGALDFLGDVDVSDMSALLQAEAAKAAAAATPVEPALSAGDLMKPLEMPNNLVSPNLKPKTKAVPMSQLDPKALGTSTTSTMTASATLGDDSSVNELLQELNVQVHHSDSEETKTEESTPPHLLKSFGDDKTGGNGMQVQTGRAQYMHQVSSKSPQDPHKKKAAAPVTATTKPDDVTAEMLSWVTGYRDPEVIRRKENMRRKRKHTHRYGMTSEEEQHQVLLQVKRIIRESDSDSEDDMSSDYSPAEDEEIPEPDEPDVVDLLSDDYLDSDEDKRPAKRKRKRLRQAETSTKKKKTHSRKPAVTRKVTQGATSSTTSSPVNVQEARPLSSSAGNGTGLTPATTTEESDDGKPNHPIELLSSGDETGDSDKGSTPQVHVDHSKSNHSADSNAKDSEVSKESTILRLKIPQDRLLEEHNQEQEPNPAEATNAFSTAPGAVDKISADSVIPSGVVSPETAAAERTQESGTHDDSTNITNTAMHPSGASDDDADLSDTGTVDFEGEDLSVETEENIDQDNSIAAELVVDSGTDKEQQGPDVNAGEKQGKAEHASGKAQSSAELEDDDVSEAETEILDDDEPDTDDLGLDYSDDSDSGDKSPSNAKNTARGEVDTATSSKMDDGTTSKEKSTSERSGDCSPNGKTTSGDKIDASRAGVQQFFDFTPLKLKPKTKTTTSTAPKPLPVHTYDETHRKKGESASGKAADDQKKSSVTPTKSTVGSNGLRPKTLKKPVATTTTMKGKYAVTRRSTKMLNPEDTPGAKRPSKSQYTMVPTKAFNNNVAKDLDDVPLAILAKEMAKKPDDKPQARYLSYAGAKKTEDAPTYAAQTPRIVSKSRYGGGGLNSSLLTTQDSSVASNGQYSQVKDKGGYRREPQISIYDALHMDEQESASDIREGAGYKRPSRFKKMQEEAARNGTPMVKSRLQDTDWDKVPIPKKKKQASQVEKSTLDAKTSKTVSVGNVAKQGGNAQNKRRKKNSASSKKNTGPSYYGPQAAQSAKSDKYDSPSRGRRGREHSSYRRDDDRRRERSPSPHSRDRDRHDRRDDRRRRGSSRSRSRSLSPRGMDYGSSRHRRRSRSRSWSRERSSERDHRRTDSRDWNRQTNGSRRSRSPDFRDSSKKKESTEPLEVGEVCQNGKIEDSDRPAKKQKTSHSSETSPLPGALAPFDDDGDNMFISDSDDDGNALIKEVEDIRFNLDSVSVDEGLMARQVYVTGVNATVFAEQIEEDFARFGVAVDRETGFPAIDIFSCQRTRFGRGDACVTFETERGALEAVEELNSKNVKNSMIRVQRMDAHTQRILTVQFQTARDTWKCTGTKCRADVSIWNAKCDKCGRPRVYGPSNIKIGAESWLCSLCFTANDSFATSCLGCKESLPEVDRATFYML
ncbi:hypothetical protein L914_07045 [Phytophthora nicotianae]|uniref:RRM domain-containing protein n=1 Tax=Phytophthora nicotianae TaxID=4792 RepID=W2NKF3_PHYNI|nr:hypothetical protein L914_07045 [Phytophthora nicotianae]